MNGITQTPRMAWLFGSMLLLTAAQTAQAEVYKCAVNGKTSYQHTQCDNKTGEQVIKITDAYQINDYYPVYIEPALPPDQELFVLRDASGKIIRSESAKNDFKAGNPCPSNNNTAGPCPGFVIDHINALACGGKDSPSNMQWQTIQAAKSKDAWERDGCSEMNSRYSQRATKSDYVSSPSSRYSGYQGSSGYQGGGSAMQTGSRGGVYHLTASGNRSYQKR